MNDTVLKHLNILQIRHDDDCPTIKSQRSEDCTCEENTARMISNLTADEAVTILTSHLEEK